jgi:predicted DNA-binding WGR domain protein
MKELILAVHQGPVSKYKLQELTGLGNTTVSRWMQMLHRSQLVYIAKWDRVGTRGNWTALWAFGYQRVDALKPKPLTNAEYLKRYRQRKAAEARTTQTKKGLKHVAD